MKDIIEEYSSSSDPIVRFKTLTKVLRRPLNDSEAERARTEIRNSPLVSTLLSEVTEEGTIPHHPYKKWTGSHWVLTLLADLDYPPGDKNLIPLREQVHDWLFSPDHLRNMKRFFIKGKYRICASQEGNAVYAMTRLGLANEKTAELVKKLVATQWPDGGWNCDKNPEAKISSFHETVTPLRGLIHYYAATMDEDARMAISKATQPFLKRRMFKRISDGRPIHPAFTLLHYPSYWYYDILYGLKVMAEGELAKKPELKEGIDLLESKRLSDGGFPAEGKNYQLRDPEKSQHSLIDWGGASKRVSNVFVSLDSLFVLAQAGRNLDPRGQTSGDHDISMGT